MGFKASFCDRNISQKTLSPRTSTLGFQCSDARRQISSVCIVRSQVCCVEELEFLQVSFVEAPKPTRKECAPCSPNNFTGVTNGPTVCMIALKGCPDWIELLKLIWKIRGARVHSEFGRYRQNLVGAVCIQHSPKLTQNPKGSPM